MSFSINPSDWLQGAAEFATGFSNAWASDNLLGAGRQEQHTTTGQAGAAFGDAAATIQGLLEIGGGGGGEAGGLALDATGVGAVVGVPVNVASAALIAHGAGVASAGFGHLLMSAAHPSDSGSFDPQSNGTQGTTPNTERPLTDAEIKQADQVRGELTKRGLEGNPMFDNMDPLVTRKVNQALSSDPLGKSPATQRAAQQWAAEGANGNPEEFANRYEYAKARYTQAKQEAAYNGAPNARTAAENAVTPDKLTAELEADKKVADSFGPGGHVTGLPANATPSDVGQAVQHLDRVAFQSDTAEAYHAVKHQGELPPEFIQTGRSEAGNYEAAYQDTIKNGQVVKAQTESNGSTQVVIQKSYAGKAAPMEAIIYVKPDGTAVLATYGGAKAVK